MKKDLKSVSLPPSLVKVVRHVGLMFTVRYSREHETHPLLSIHFYSIVELTCDDVERKLQPYLTLLNSVHSLAGSLAALHYVYLL